MPITFVHVNGRLSICHCNYRNLNTLHFKKYVLERYYHCIGFHCILQRISVTVNSGLQMCRGGNSEPTIVVQIWSIGVFGKDKNPTYADSLFEFFKEHIPSVSQERYITHLS